MHVADVEAKSWLHALDLLYADSWRHDLLRHRSCYAFRGLPDARYRLETSLIRLGGPYPDLERHLLRNFRKYVQLTGAENKFSDWRWLTLGQHHGLPTRLLDWTYSPFAALHFCTSNIERFDIDGAIWCVDYSKAHNLLPGSLKQNQELAGGDVFTVEALEAASPTLAAFDALMPEPFAVFLEPPSWDERIVNQFALFSVLSTSSITFDDWLLTSNVPFRRVIIPASVKWEIRDKLDQANLTERVFFPGLDGLAVWLKRHYSPR